MKILGVITARANSTRLPNKNLKKIKNKSLIEITINFSKKLNILFDILVTSDSKKINDIAKKNKINFVEKRPNGLSMKNTSSATTVINAIKWYEKKYEKIDSIILLQPTTPFRDIKFVNNCIEKFLKFKKPVISVHRLKKKIMF